MFYGRRRRGLISTLIDLSAERQGRKHDEKMMAAERARMSEMSQQRSRPRSRQARVPQITITSEEKQPSRSRSRDSSSSSDDDIDHLPPYDEAIQRPRSAQPDYGSRHDDYYSPSGPQANGTSLDPDSPQSPTYHSYDDSFLGSSRGMPSWGNPYAVGFLPTGDCIGPTYLTPRERLHLRREERWDYGYGHRGYRRRYLPPSAYQGYQGPISMMLGQAADRKAMEREPSRMVHAAETERLRVDR